MDPFTEMIVAGHHLENASIGSNPIVWNVLSPDSGIEDDTSRTSSTCSQPRLHIVDEPESNYRFRYARESRKPHGPIKSKSSANVPKNISHGPRVKLLDYEGEAIIRGWLFQGSLQPGKTLGPSPNCLVKTKGRGQTDLFYEPHDLVVNQSNDYTASFDNYNILHVVKSEKNYQKLYLKKKRSVAPRLGSLYVRDPPEVPDDFDKDEVMEDFKSSEKNICCLYFEAFGKCGDDYVLLCRQLSSPIRNIKNAENNLLKIVKQSHVDGPCSGGTEVMIFTEKLIKDIKIIFFEDDWQAEGIFKESDIHKRVGLAFKTPPYHDQHIDNPVTVSFVMLRIHDGEMSEPHEFRYMPMAWIPEMKRKRPIPRTPCKDPFLSEAIIGDCDPLLSKTEDDDMLGASSLEEGVSTGDLFKAPVILDDLFDEHLVADSFHHERPVVQGSSIPKDTDPFDVDPTLQLRFFTEMGMPEVVNSYLEMGGDPYALDDSFSSTTMHSAVLKPSLICLQILLRSVEPKPVFNRDGDDLVLHAVRYKKVEALKLLLLKGFSSYSSNVKNGDTPLHVAVENELFDAIDLLIQHGASVSDCNYAGTSVLEYARSTKNEEMLRKLLPYVVSDDEHDGIDKLMETLDITDNKTDDSDDSDEDESALEEEESINNERASAEGGESIPNDEATLKETLAALDGDVETSLEVANLLGCGFLAPILKNAQRQSCILLNYLKMKDTHENAVAVLNRYTLAAKANIPKS